jgi:phage terminase large subunit-like protein
MEPEPIQWIEDNFYIPETGRPMELYPCQEIPLREALSRDALGQFRYSTVVWSAIKKSAKSSIAAAVGLWFAFRRPWSSVKVIANDLKQADSRVAYYMRRAILLHPEWSKTVKVSGYKITLPNHSAIEAIPIDPKGEAGGNDDLVIYSEIWGWKEKASLAMWSETTLSPMKYGQSMRFCETYAGYVGESPILEQLYESGVTDGHVLDAEHEMYTNGRLFVLWMTKPALPWQNLPYYSQEAATLMPNEFDRVHRNQWVSSTGSFVQPEWWDACKGTVPAPETNEQLVVALDASVSGDCFGILAATRKDGKTIPRFIRKWTPPNGGKIQYTPPPGVDIMDTNYPSGFIRWLVETRNVLEVAYDPYQLHSLASALAQELVTYFREFNQASDRLVADKSLQDAIKAREILHDGNEDLTEHVVNAAAKVEGEKIRIVKKTESKKIDLCVCLSMAHAECTRLSI